jgi:hypothetical protein
MLVKIFTNCDKNSNNLFQTCVVCNNYSLQRLCLQYIQDKITNEFTQQNIDTKLLEPAILNKNLEIFKLVKEFGFKITEINNETILNKIFKSISYKRTSYKIFLTEIIKMVDVKWDKELISDFMSCISFNVNNYSNRYIYEQIEHFFIHFHNIKELYTKINLKFNMVSILIDNCFFRYNSITNIHNINMMSDMDYFYVIKFIDYNYLLFDIPKNEFQRFDDKYLQYITTKMNKPNFNKNHVKSLVECLLSHGNILTPAFLNMMLSSKLYTQNEINNLEIVCANRAKSKPKCKIIKNIL